MLNSFHKPWARLAVALCVTVWCAIGVAGHCAEPLPVEYAWQHDPLLDFSWWRQDTLPTLHLSTKELQSRFAAERLQAVQTIVRLPEQAGRAHPELLQALIARLEQGEPEPNVRANIVAAACELDDGSYADRLWQVARNDSLLRPTVEQACIRWRKPILLDIWRSELSAKSSSDQDTLRAIQGIGAVGMEQDIAQLAAIALDGTRPAAWRLAAARAIGNLATSDQLPLARKLRASSALYPDLLAVLVVGKQATPPNEEFMVDVADQGTALAQRHAYRWLCDMHTDIAKAKAVTMSKHSDAEVRRMSLDQAAQVDNDEALEIMQTALGDVHPDLRKRAREFLLERSTRSAEHKRSIEKIVESTIGKEDWQSIEQCLRLAVDLHLPAHVPRMIELLEHTRPEVCITAAWALRHLATDESSLQAMLEHADRLTRTLSTPSETAMFEELDLRRVAHLLEALGIRGYAPAQETLLKYVPKNDQRMGMITRMAGIWACGKMWEGKDNRALADELCARIADSLSPVAEPVSIRFSAMLALGWMADPETRAAIETYGEPKPSPIGYATDWALKRLDEREAR